MEVVSAAVHRLEEKSHSSNEQASGQVAHLTCLLLVFLLAATYQEGQTVEVQVLITTNHYGRFEFRLCPAAATKDTDCQKLQR